ncbi:MAG: ABC transporter permease [Actinomycetota bacterium]|nr:ABC transporter permease [Actinomycetota bacterium]
MVLVGILSLPFAYVLARKPVLRRLAVRNARRRPRETMLVLLGSLLGTAIITGSFIVGDTLEASIRRSAFTQLGPVDEVVRTPGPEAAADAEQALRSMPAGTVDGTLRLLSIQAAVATPGPNPRAEPTANVYEVDFAEARRFGGDAEATGMRGDTPGPGEAVIGADLARTLAVGSGDRLVVNAYGARSELVVVGQLPRLGIAGLGGEQSSESPNLFVAPGTIAPLRAGASEGARAASPPTAAVLVSNPGDVLGGAERTDAVKATLERALDGIPATVEPAKQNLLRSAKTNGDQFTELFSSIGFFSVLAGILLLVNIFVMLVQERKTELGMMRAVGLKRAGLVGSFATEGWLYALAASAIGTVAGLGVGRLVVLVAAGIFATGDFTLELRYQADLASIQQGFTIGFVISLVTVVATSLWVSRLNVIRAIRDLPEPDTQGQRLAALVFGFLLTVVGGALTISGVSGEEPFSTMGGPAVGGLGAVLLLRRWLPRRALVSLASVGVLVWAVAVFEVFPRIFEDADIPIFVEQGIILTTAAVALVTQNQDVVGTFVRRVGGSQNMPLRLGLAYPLARRFRTGMILTMYALVVFTLTFITVLSHLFEGQIDQFTRKASGGFDIRLGSNPANPVPVGSVRGTEGVEEVAEMAVMPAEWEGATTEGFEGWPVAGFDEALVSRGGPHLTTIDVAYADERAAYRAVLADPSLVIVNEFFLQEGGGGPPEAPLEPGETIIMRDALSGRSRQLTVAAVSEGGFANEPAMVARRTVDEVFGAVATTNALLLSVTPGADAEALADRLNGQFLANGANADSFRKTVSENLAQQTQFFRLMQGYLALGLVVGIAGLGVVMVRAVRERRRQIGVLRSLGFEAADVRKAFIAESAFVALEGVVVGCVLANLTAWRLVGSGAFGEDLGFSIPWVELGALVLGTFLASLLATVTPAQQASRIRPAVALRLAD